MRIVFMGTPEFAVPCLSALIEKHDVLAVFTQPDKPKGRKDEADGEEKLSDDIYTCLLYTSDAADEL